MTDRFTQYLPTPPLEETWTVCEQCGRWPTITVVVRSIDGGVVYRKIKTSQPIALCKGCGVTAFHRGQQIAGYGVVTLNLFAPYVVARNQKWLTRLKRLPHPRPSAPDSAAQSIASSVTESTGSSERALPLLRPRALALLRRALALLRRALALLRRAMPPLRRALALLRRAMPPLRRALVVLLRGALALLRRALPLLRRALALLRRALALLRRALALLRRALALLRRALVAILRGALALLPRALPLLRRALPLLRRALPLLRRALPLLRRALPLLRRALPSTEAESTASSAAESTTASSEAETSHDLVTEFVTDINDRIGQGARLAGTPIPRGFAEYEALGNHGGGLSPSELEAFSIWVAWVSSRSGYVAMEIPTETQIEIVMYRLENGEISDVSVDEGKRAATAFPHLLRLSKDVDRIVSSKIRVPDGSQVGQMQRASAPLTERPSIEFDTGRGKWVCTTHRDPACPVCPGAYDILVARNHERRRRSQTSRRWNIRIGP